MALVTSFNEPISQAAIVADRRAWGICWLMFASTVLCYMDRQTISLVKPAVMAEFGITRDETYGWLMASFMLPYALFQVPAGFLADSGNARRIYAWAVGGWSLAGLASAFSPSLGFLIACRVMLGVGESFNWPCGLRITSRILPPSDRGLGNGIFNSGAAVGAVIAPLTIPLIAHQFGWRAAFASVAGLGFVWVAVWQILRPGEATESAPIEKRNPDPGLSNLAITAFSTLGIVSVAVALVSLRWGPIAIVASLALLMMGTLVLARILPESELAGRRWSASLGVIVRRRRFWVLVVVSISINVCWHYLVNWMADFFQTERHLGMVGGAMLSSVPFLAADAGNLVGGGLSRSLTRRGVSVITSRKSVMTVSAGLVACGASVGLIHSTEMIVVVLSLMAVGAASLMANYFALCQDVAPCHTGLVVGILGGLGNLFAASFLPLAGRLKYETGGAAINFAIVGLLPIVGLIVLWVGWGQEDLAEKPS